MNVSESKDIIKNLMIDAATLSLQRMRDHIASLAADGVTYLSVYDRISLIKEFGTVRIAVGRRSGTTTAAIEFADEFYGTARVVHLCPDKAHVSEYYEDLGASEVVRWSGIEHIDYRGIVALIVDPGPHSGPQARDAIYRCAAEAMLTNGDGLSPVTVYFVGT